MTNDWLARRVAPAKASSINPTTRVRHSMRQQSRAPATINTSVGRPHTHHRLPEKQLVGPVRPGQPALKRTTVRFNNRSTAPWPGEPRREIRTPTAHATAAESVSASRTAWPLARSPPPLSVSLETAASRSLPIARRRRSTLSINAPSTDGSLMQTIDRRPFSHPTHARASERHRSTASNFMAPRIVSAFQVSVVDCSRHGALGERLCGGFRTPAFAFSLPFLSKNARI